MLEHYNVGSVELQLRLKKTLVTFARNRTRYTIIKNLSKKGIKTVTTQK